MAEELVNGIVQALIAGQQRRAQRFRENQQFDLSNRQFEEQKKRDDAAQAERDRQFGETQSQHKFENQQTELTNKAINAFRGIQQLHELQGIQEQANKTGQAPPGATLNTVPGEMGEPDSTTMIIPGTDVRLPFDPEGYRATLTATKTAEDAPAHQNRIDELRQQEESQARLASSNKEADSARYEKQKKDDYDRAIAVEQLRGRNERSLAQIKANLKPESNFDPTPYIQGGVDGTISKEEISKLPKDQKAIVLDNLSQIGVIPLSDKQKQFVGALGGAVNVVPQMDQYIDNLDKNPTTARIGVGTDAYAKGSQLQNQIKEGLVQASGSLMAGTSNRLSNQRVTAMNDAYGVSGNPTYDNKQKREAYIQNLNAVVDQELQGATPAQIAHIKEKVGLSQYLKPKEPAKKTTVIRFDSQGNQIPEGK